MLSNVLLGHRKQHFQLGFQVIGRDRVEKQQSGTIGFKSCRGPPTITPLYHATPRLSRFLVWLFSSRKIIPAMFKADKSRITAPGLTGFYKKLERTVRDKIRYLHVPASDVGVKNEVGTWIAYHLPAGLVPSIVRTAVST